MALEAEILITLVYCPAPRKVMSARFTLREGATLGDALNTVQAQSVLQSLDLKAVGFGVWGRKAKLSQVLQTQDRVEIYRFLKVDPKVARRERFAKQGAKTAGLFAKRRLGAKAGY